MEAFLTSRSAGRAGWAYEREREGRQAGAGRRAVRARWRWGRRAEGGGQRAWGRGPGAEGLGAEGTGALATAGDPGWALAGGGFRARWVPWTASRARARGLRLLGGEGPLGAKAAAHVRGRFAG